VKGYQDVWGNIGKLDRLALLNIEVDYWAKEFWAERVEDHKYFTYTTPKGMWRISMLGYRVCKNIMQYLRESIEGGKVAEYWICKRKRMTEQGYFQVDWEANKAAMQAVPVSRRHWVSKFESGMCGSGKMMKIWKQRLVDNCPRCNAECETPTHILQCQSSSAKITWDKSMVKLTEWMKTNKTCPDIIRLILHGITKWRMGEEITPLRDLEFDDVTRIFGAQQQIGWRSFMGGCISFEWAKVQGDYYKWIGRKKTGKRWAVALIQKLWDVSWDQWECRNGALHNTPMAADLSGALSLDRAISAECLLGPRGLPLRVQMVFPSDISTLLTSPLIERKCWLVLVRAAREIRQDTRIQDEFSHPQSSLRTWVGL